MYKIIALTALIILCAGCEKQKDGDGSNNIQQIDSHPIAVGSKWTYNRELSLQYSPDSLENDTMHSTIRVWIEKDTVLNDTMEVARFVSQNNRSGTRSFHYMYIDNEGFKCYAYENGDGINTIAQKSVHSSFKTTSEPDSLMPGKNIFYNQPPALNLKLPLRSNTTWTYTRNKVVNIRKEVLGFETVSVNNQEFLCCKIKWDWEYVNNSTTNSPDITDWVSEKGLVKRKRQFKDLTFTNETGEPLYNVEPTAIITLQDYSLK